MSATRAGQKQDKVGQKHTIQAALEPNKRVHPRPKHVKRALQPQVLFQLSTSRSKVKQQTAKKCQEISSREKLKYKIFRLQELQNREARSQ